MRNTTKLKHVLSKYSLGVDMDDEGMFKLTLVDKFLNNEIHTVEGKSWSIVVTKAYSILLKDLKK